MKITAVPVALEKVAQLSAHSSSELQGSSRRLLSMKPRHTVIGFDLPRMARPNVYKLTGTDSNQERVHVAQKSFRCCA